MWRFCEDFVKKILARHSFATFCHSFATFLKPKVWQDFWASTWGFIFFATFSHFFSLIVKKKKVFIYNRFRKNFCENVATMKPATKV